MVGDQSRLGLIRDLGRKERDKAVQDEDRGTHRRDDEQRGPQSGRGVADGVDG